MSPSVVLPISLCALLAASPVAARDLGFIANAWQIFMTECAKVFADPTAYAQALPPANADGSLNRTVSGDGKSVRFHVQHDAGFIEASIYTLSDRELRHCGFYEDFAPDWDTADMATQFTAWLGQSPGVEIVGGSSSIHEFPESEHRILGLWPSYDISVLSMIHENEYQLYAMRIVR